MVAEQRNRLVFVGPVDPWSLLMMIAYSKLPVLHCLDFVDRHPALPKDLFEEIAKEDAIHLHLLMDLAQTSQVVEDGVDIANLARLLVSRLISSCLAQKMIRLCNCDASTKLSALPRSLPLGSSECES